MRITLITQDEPFYLAENINHLIKTLPEHSKVISCVLLPPSPYGKKESLLNKALKTRKLFGNSFFIRYCFKYLRSKLSSRNVRRVLINHGINIIELSHSINHQVSLEIIRSHNPDLLISIAGNEIFKKQLIDLAPKGCLNLHTALLPKYRGLMPSFWVLKNREKQTGVSVFFVDEGIDSGPILVQKNIAITKPNLEDLIIKSKKVGMMAICEAVDLINRGNYKCIPNNDDEMTYFHFPSKSDVKEFIQNGAKFY